MRPRRHRGAHAMLSGVFLARGAAVLQDPKPFAAHAEPLAAALARSLELTADPAALARANGVAQVIGGLGLALDYLPRLAATLLGTSVGLSMLWPHAFWREDDPATRRPEEAEFLKSLAILGGLLVVATERRPKRSAAA